MGMLTLTKVKSIERDTLFKKGDLYYARLQHNPGDEPLEIALHGVMLEKQARAVVKALLQRNGTDPHEKSLG